MAGYIHNEGEFQGKNDIRIFSQTWKVNKPKGIVVLVHGLGEHSNRYMNIINELDGKGISFYAIDHRGHGRSGGKRGHVDNFMDYIHDMKILVNMARDENPEVPLFMLGHSLGGAIACRYALTYESDLKGLILSGPGVKPILNMPGFVVGMAKFMANILPSMGQSNGIDASDLSHDSEVVKAYVEDELNHDRITYGWFAEFLKNGEYCIERAEELTLPLLLIHGGEDKLCDVKGTQALLERSSSMDKEIQIFDGLFHETMNEEEDAKAEVLKTVAKWIVSHIGSKKTSAKKTAKKVAKKAVKKTTKKVAKKSAKKTTAKKTTAKKTAKKTTAKKATAKKAVKKITAKKTTAKKTAAKKSTAKKTTKKK